MPNVKSSILDAPFLSEIAKNSIYFIESNKIMLALSNTQTPLLTDYADNINTLKFLTEI